jgi:nucleoside phosphorylase/CheY-like chemotaxis protein
LSIKILLVDDDQKKLASLVHLLSGAGASREIIDIAQTGVQARSFLSETRYDLLILDVAIPMRPEDPADRVGGIKLLEEVAESGNYKLPRHVVGLTGFADLRNEFNERFYSRLWILEHYQPAETGWADRLSALARHVIAHSRQTDAAVFGVDLCVVTALNNPELIAVRELPWNWSKPESFEGVGYYYKGSFESRSRVRTVVAAAAPRMGMVAMAVLCTKMIATFRPRLLVMTGICGGIQGTCEIGDVLVADPAWDWQMGKYIDKTFLIAPDQIDIPTAVAQRFVQMSNDTQIWFEINDSFKGKKPRATPAVKVGPVSSGASVVADARVLRSVREQHRNALGIEMELYGMYAAARDCSSPRPVTFGIKSVCDFADKRKNDGFQEYSSYVSARVLQAFCERYAGDFMDDQV